MRTITKGLRAVVALSCMLAFAVPTTVQGTDPTEAGQNTEQKGEAQRSSEPLKQIAIIIDDFGNEMRGTKEMMELPATVTVAIMPFMHTSKRDAQWAHKAGHDVIIHMPMEPKRGRRSWLGPNPITTDLSDEEVRKRVEAAIDDIPFAIGMNNHMGSKVVENEHIMRIVMEVCKERGILFIDSRTSHRTKVPKLAKELHMPYIGNEIFFDDVNTKAHISKQIRVLEKYMKDHSFCVAIGHVGDSGRNMASVLRTYIPELQKHFKLVGISELAASKSTME